MLEITNTKMPAQWYDVILILQDIGAFDKDLAESNRKAIELEARLEG